MRKLLTVATAALMLAALAPQAAKAAATQNITITISITATVSVALDSNTWNLAGSAFSTDYISSAYTITNDGSVNQALKVKGNDSAGPNVWTLAGAIGANQYKLQALIGQDAAAAPVTGKFSLDGTDALNNATYVVATATDIGDTTWSATCGDDVAPAGACDMYLKLSTPTGGYTSTMGSIVVTVSANAL